MMERKGHARAQALPLVIVCLLYAATRAHDTVLGHICTEDEKVVECEHMIQIDSAWYGSGKPKDCTTIKDVCGCNVTDSLHKNCTGRSKCRLKVLKQYLQCDGGQQPVCLDDFTKHLSFAYKCLKGLDLLQLKPCSGSPIVIHDTSGYISSWMTTQTGRGNATCPWLIEAQPGQRIHLDWELFGGGSENLKDYIHINDNNTKLSPTDLYYVSTGWKVTITTRTDKNGKASGTFVLRFNVTGCKSGDNMSDCSSNIVPIPKNENTSKFPLVEVVIGIVVGLGVIAVIVVVVWFSYRKKARSHNMPKRQKDEKDAIQPLTNGDDRSPTSSSPPKDSIYYASAPVPYGKSPTDRDLPLTPTELAQVKFQAGYADPKSLGDSDMNLNVEHTYAEPEEARRVVPPVNPQDPPPKPLRQPHLSSGSPPGSRTGSQSSPPV